MSASHAVHDKAAWEPQHPRRRTARHKLFLVHIDVLADSRHEIGLVEPSVTAMVARKHVILVSVPVPIPVSVTSRHVPTRTIADTSIATTATPTITTPTIAVAATTITASLGPEQLRVGTDGGVVHNVPVPLITCGAIAGVATSTATISTSTSTILALASSCRLAVLL